MSRSISGRLVGGTQVGNAAGAEYGVQEGADGLPPSLPMVFWGKIDQSPSSLPYLVLVNSS